jgi:hypothetical protein
MVRPVGFEHNFMGVGQGYMYDRLWSLSSNKQKA